MSDDIRTAIIEDPDVLQFAQDGWTLRVTVPGGVTSYLLRQGGRWHGHVLDAITDPTIVERLELLNPDEQLPLGTPLSPSPWTSRSTPNVSPVASPGGKMTSTTGCTRWPSSPGCRRTAPSRLSGWTPTPRRSCSSTAPTSATI